MGKEKVDIEEDEEREVCRMSRTGSRKDIKRKESVIKAENKQNTEKMEKKKTIEREKSEDDEA